MGGHALEFPGVVRPQVERLFGVLVRSAVLAGKEVVQFWLVRFGCWDPEVTRTWDPQKHGNFFKCRCLVCCRRTCRNWRWWGRCSTSRRWARTARRSRTWRSGKRFCRSIWGKTFRTKTRSTNTSPSTWCRKWRRRTSSTKAWRKSKVPFLSKKTTTPRPDSTRKSSSRSSSRKATSRVCTDRCWTRTWRWRRRTTTWSGDRTWSPRSRLLYNTSSTPRYTPKTPRTRNSPV